MEKDYILNHMDDLTAQQLADAINQSIVTLDELRATNNLDNTKRKAIVALLTQKEKENDDAWERLKYGNENSLRDYITNFPTGKYVREAKTE